METLGPITAKIKTKISGARVPGGIYKDVDRTFIAELNGFDLIIFDVTDKNNKIEVAKSVKDKNYQFQISGSGLGLPKEAQKSINENVYGDGKTGFYKNRLDAIQKLSLDQRINAYNSSVPGVQDPTEVDPDPNGKFESVDPNLVITPNVSDAEFTPFDKKLFYPETLDKNDFEQDYIKFNVLEYKPKSFTLKNFEVNPRFISEKGENTKTIVTTVFLPIQGGISDSNNVNWADDSMDAVQRAGAYASLSLQGSKDQIQFKEKIETILKSGAEMLQDPKLSNALTASFQSLMARMAINSGSNFFSRAFGAILNPNLELLFSSPTLRNFSFRFDLTPRNKDEAIQVRKIIRVFKQTMSPRVGIANIFLKTPMIYEISYINGKDSNTHKSMNRIKTCALRSFNVNYTPINQFMTYDDPENTMTAYSIDMGFVELEPVLYDDFREIKQMDEIGY